MKELVITCDHCGKRLNNMVDYNDLDIELKEWIDTDLCSNCYEELTKLVKQFTNK